MAVTTSGAISVRVFVPLWTNGTQLVTDPALTNFINTAKSLTVDGIIYQSEAHDYGWDVSWFTLEFITTTANASSLETAASTLQAALNTQNGNPAPALVVKAQATAMTNVVFS
jgi:hypothetical protein